MSHELRNHLTGVVGAAQLIAILSLAYQIFGEGADVVAIPRPPSAAHGIDVLGPPPPLD